MKNSLFIGLTMVILASCSGPSQSTQAFDLQGHRGCRGLMPENTIPAFIKALDLGVTTLEMDLAVTKDHELVVSHEPYMSAEMCLDSAGNEISEAQQLQYNIYQMTYQEVAVFDCGSKVHPRFPEQQKMQVAKPRLMDVIDRVESYLKTNNKPLVAYNIEIKSLPETDDTFHPAPPHFSDMVFGTLDKKLDWNRVTIQSFDFRVLQYFHERYPDVKLALLIENELLVAENLDSLGFTPDIYSCYFPLLSRESVNFLHSQSISVIPWTVNEVADMKDVMKLGVDGLITDYPDRFNSIKN
ncbi:MAG: glycerophosphodiester phosphodiesterase family protein [Marinoscillum sp.]|uniref:glycerophosphodiester phosphodiesterase family protein n=1 Tax=Marinoscillum sp. TaxID=2024838 RepID=UPI0032F30A55